MTDLIRDILDFKGYDVHAVSPTLSVTEAVAFMERLGIGALAVIDGEHLTGIFTERDVVARIVHAELEPGKTLVYQAMTANPITISPDTTVKEAMEQVTRTHCRHLPVMDGKRLMGMISIGDLTRWILRSQPPDILD